jgi:hypothetical protein
MFSDADSYVNHRLVKTRELYWETGPVIPDRIRNETLSSKENDYFTAYCNILSEYSESMGGIDLLSDIEVSLFMRQQVNYVVVNDVRI